MTNYKAPLRDIGFAMNEVLGYPDHYAQLPAGEELSSEVVSAVLTELAKFCESELEPLNRSGDEEGCRWDNGEVTTPEGFKEVYNQYVAAGWTSVAGDPGYGGQGLPPSLNKVLSEMLATANIGFSLYLSGAAGATETIAKFGTAQQRALYEKPIVDGKWSATMCLTEAHSGTDLGLLRTQAEPQADGSYAISGTKIFITGGEQDLTENIVHIVLARLPEAPAGTKGISLFIVPKYKVDDSGEMTERNAVYCGSIEKKMGVKASSTCVMNFDDASGYLLGEPNRGLYAMFTFMNASRIGAGIQGVAHAELGLQKSVAYSRDRLQMRALTGPKNPSGIADPIIVHPDVRRMLLTQKVFAEGNRMLNFYLAKHLDIVECSLDDDARSASKQRLDFMTPIAKAFSTETGFESANLALQCFGGHGYIREWGLEQNVRDARIAMLYEGTTGIQALDLLGRKVMGSGGRMLVDFIAEVNTFCHSQDEGSEFYPLIRKLMMLLQEWNELTQTIAHQAAIDPDEIGAASVNYLMYSGYVCLAYFWVKAALVAYKQLMLERSEADFYHAKIASAQFYYQHILPRTLTCSETIKVGAASLMALDERYFHCG